MKPLTEFLEMGAADRAKFLKATAINAKKAARMIAKVLYAGEAKGDYGANEMNAYAQKTTGLDIRREIQGTYEAVRVLRKIHNNTLPLTEADFDSILGFAITSIAGFIAADPDKTDEACEIAKSNVDVVKRLKALKAQGGKQKSPPANPGTGQDGGGSASEIQTSAAGPDLEALERFLASLGETPLFSFEAIRNRLKSDVEAAPTAACCDSYLALSKSLKGYATSRRAQVASGTGQLKLVA